MAEEQVTAPDQHRPRNRRKVWVGGVFAIVALLAMTSPFNNHSDWVSDFYLVLTAGLIALALVGDVVMRRRGLRR